ncbi:MAG: S8 family serine peptidase [Candidatus Margulisbacteria bacterium]|nr:S8 family serine peptidase [Candidatus Margulisiibacteriota bacterium]
MRFYKFYLYLVLLIIASCFGLQSFAEVVPNQVIVKFKPGVVKLPKGVAISEIKTASVAAASVRALNAKYKVAKLEQMYKDALLIRPDWKHLENDYILTLTETTDAARAVREYKKDANVESAATNSYVRAFDVTPNDHYYVDEWGLPQIKAPSGWVKTTGSATSIIAILDTGINYNHEDLAAKVDLTDAKSYVSYTSDVLDDAGHGTAVSGVIGAVTNNGIGIAGVNWNTKLLPIKVLDQDGSGVMSSISQALAYLAALKTTGTNIVAVNMSLGQYNSGADKYAEEDPSNIKERCQEAFSAGIVLVAAAGNDNVNWNTYPAYYTTVLGVSAIDQNDKRSVWGGGQASNYGAWVDVAAPGTGIFSTNMNGGYLGGWNGTSLASPFVAGLAGLVKAANPAMTSTQIMNQIKTFADNIDALNPGFEGQLGTGRINCYRALAGLVSSLSSPSSGEYIRKIRSIIGTAGGWNFQKYRIDALKNDVVDTTIVSNVTTSVEAGPLADWDTTGRNGPYTLRLFVEAADGSTSEADVAVIVDNITPEAAITSPANGVAVAGSLQILGRATDAYLDRYLLEYGAGSNPASFQNIGTFYVSTSGLLGTWETAGLSGNYTLRLTAYDHVGNVSSESIALSVQPESPVKAAQASGTLPLTYALPNPFIRSASSETSFNYSLLGNFNATIFLFDLNGNLVWQKSYQAGDNGGKSGANSPAWDGRDLYGAEVVNGVYLYQVTADKKIIARGKIIVLN